MRNSCQLLLKPNSLTTCARTKGSFPPWEGRSGRGGVRHEHDPRSPHPGPLPREERESQSNSRAGIARFFRGIGLGWLLILQLSLPSCSKAAPIARPDTSAPVVSPAPAVSSAVAVPTDLGTQYRALLVGDTIDKQRQIFQLGYRFWQEKNHEGARVFLNRALE